MVRRRGLEEPAADERDLGPPADPGSVARTILLNKLTGQARSRHELAEALEAKHVPPDVATAALDRFEEVGMIDDQAFAVAWVESRQSTRGLSRRALAFELRRKGVADDVILDSVDAIDPERERALARDLVDRRLRSTRRLDRQSRFRRLTAALARKGYPAGLCAAVVRAAIAADERASGASGAGELDEVVREDFGVD
ncbi:MAG: regulatory protein RecX [Propionibacteriales bacterium]|nr:regulatory protein RecX [Propionibacteriales bacterium]